MGFSVRIDPQTNLPATIWVFDHYARAGDGANTRTFDTFRQVARHGPKVTIFASSFSHYSFQETRLSGWKLWQSQTVDGVQFVWVRTFPYRWNDWRRAVNMLSYLVVAGAAALQPRERPEVVVGASVHPFAALIGYVISSLFGAPFFFLVGDLWPQTLIEFGRISRDGVTARVLRALERFLFQRAERIFMLWRHTEEYVASTGTSPRKVVWVPQGADLDRFTDLPAYDGAARKPFTVMYLGGFVDGMDIGTIVGAASELQNRGRSDITFALVGSSTNKSTWIQRVSELGLKNVTFPPPVPKDEIARVMRDADAFIYGVRDLPMYQYGISTNKLVDYLASGRPIIFSGRSTYDPVAETGAGFSVPPEDPAAVADAIERLVALSAAERATMGDRGHAYMLQYHHAPRLAERVLAHLTQAHARRRARAGRGQKGP